MVCTRSKEIGFLFGEKEKAREREYHVTKLSFHHRLVRRQGFDTLHCARAEDDGGKKEEE